MAGSYERINYSLRPAKSIERKMLCDTFRRLTEFGSVESYTYIGFGSTYFSDFSLFHKQLGIKNMISLEQDEQNKERFEFNRPFKCINIKFGPSNETLPTLRWDIRTITWLDYDGRLTASMLTDVEFVCQKVISGSMLIISVNAQPDKPDKPDIDRVESLKERVGRDNVPEDIQDEHLAGWGTAKTYRRILTNVIRQTLNEKNGGRPSGAKIAYKQVFNFHYADGAKMLTVGGLFYEEGQSNMVAKCNFESLEFVRTNEDAYRIDVPSLTYREIRHLEAQLPEDNECSELDISGIRKEDLNNYQKLYRYFPAFVEADV